MLQNREPKIIFEFKKERIKEEGENSVRAAL
jgi:hypothetical protein